MIKKVNPLMRQYNTCFNYIFPNKTLIHGWYE